MSRFIILSFLVLAPSAFSVEPPIVHDGKTPSPLLARPPSSAPKEIINGTGVETIEVLVDDSLPPRPQACGLGVVPEVDLAAVSDEIETKAAKWLFGVEVLAHEYAEIRNSEALKYPYNPKQFAGRYAQTLENSYSDPCAVASEGCLTASGLLAAESIIQSGKGKTGLSQQFFYTLGTLGRIAALIPVAHAPASSFGGTSADILRRLVPEQLTLEQEKGWVTALDTSANKQVAAFATVMDWDEAESNRFVAALRAYSMKQATIQRANDLEFGRFPNVQHVLGRVSTEDVIRIAQQEGLMTAHEAAALRDLKKLSEKFPTITPELTAAGVASTLSEDGGFQAKKRTLEDNIIAVEVYRTVLNNLKKELTRKGVPPSKLTEDLDRILADVESAHDTLKMMCQLGHFKKLGLFDPSEFRR